MEEIQRTLTQRYEGAKQRKVRFKLASSYSGRVLKHVYEDGQEVDSPEEKYPHSFLHRKLPPSHLELEQLCGFQEQAPEDQQGVYPPTGLIAQRINVYRGLDSYKPAVSHGDGAEGDPNAPVLDFGKIIIYTSNLRIIRAPRHRAPDTPPPSIPDAPMRRSGEPEPRPHGSSSRSSSGGGRRRRSSRRSPSSTRDGGSRERGKERSKERGKERRKPLGDAEDKAAVASGGVCQQCGGSGRAPCPLCHGSKLSTLAHRFHASISDLRCPACHPHGLGPCRACCPNASTTTTTTTATTQ